MHASSAEDPTTTTTRSTTPILVQAQREIEEQKQHNCSHEEPRPLKVDDTTNTKDDSPPQSKSSTNNDSALKGKDKDSEVQYRKSNKKARKSKGKNFKKSIDWSKVNDSDIIKHVGYMKDYSKWIVSCTNNTDNSDDISNNKKQKQTDHQERNSNSSSTAILPETVPDIDDVRNIPESVRQYERQLKKQRAEARVGRTINLDDIHILYVDEDIVVTDKPSGVLTVPGIYGRTSSLAQIVCNNFGCESGNVSKVIVHRLDMDTSGVVVFAKTNAALKELHRSFRELEVSKTYEALVCGHVSNEEGQITLPLQRDHKYPPFMRVATKESEIEAAQVVKDLQHAGWKALIRKAPKESTTHYRVLAREYWQGQHPVTRLALTPITGRTHQLRVHCAAIGHHIVGDQTYGFLGEAAEYGGLLREEVEQQHPSFASLELQQQIDTKARKLQTNLCLHAKQLCLPHPTSGQLMMFESPPPF